MTVRRESIRAHISIAPTINAHIFDYGKVRILTTAPGGFRDEDLIMRTFNARIYARKEMLEIRQGLNAEQVCEFAREVASRDSSGDISLLIEQLWNGENEQQFLDREFPGAIASGFVFYANQLSLERIEYRCQDFMDVFGGAQ